MNKYKKLLSNTAAMTVGQFSSKILSFLLIPLYTSILSTEEYGIYDIIVTTVTLLTPFLTLVISEAILRFAIDNDYDNRYVLTIGVTLVVLGSGVLILLLPIFSFIGSIAKYRIWIVVFFFVMNLHTVLIQFLKGINKVTQYSIMGVISTMTTLSLNIYFLVIRNYGIVGYLLAATMSHLLVSLIIIIHNLLWMIIIIHNKLWTYVVNPLSIPRNVYKDMLRFSVPMIPNSISWWVSDSSDKYVILWFLSSAEVGLYSIAYKIPTLLTMVMSLFVSAFQISIFDEFKKEDGSNFFKTVYTSVMMALLVAASMLIFASKYLAVVLYKNSFYSAWMVGCILIFAFVFNSLSSLIGTIYTATKKTSVLFYSTLAAACVNIALNIILIPCYGLYGAAFATLVSYVCVWLIRALLAKKQMEKGFIDRNSLIILVLIAFQIVIELSSLEYKMFLSFVIVLLVIAAAYKKLRNSILYDKITTIIERRK